MDTWWLSLGINGDLLLGSPWNALRRRREDFSDLLYKLHHSAEWHVLLWQPGANWGTFSALWLGANAVALLEWTGSENRGRPICELVALVYLPVWLMDIRLSVETGFSSSRLPCGLPLPSELVNLGSPSFPFSWPPSRLLGTSFSCILAVSLLDGVLQSFWLPFRIVLVQVKVLCYLF